ncbi:MAG: PQQ-dependent sugar dehydrogenase [Microthrixaceae bacterium]
MTDNLLRFRSTSIRLVAVATAVLLSGVALFGCSSDGQTDGHSGGSASESSQTTPDGPADPGPGGDPGGPLKIELEKLDVDLASPIAATPGPTEDSMIVAERGGTVRLLTFDGADASLSEPIIDISDEVSTDSERGLLGVALSPNSSRLFISYTSAGDGTSHLDAYDVEDSDASRFQVDERSRLKLLSVTQPFPNHNGGDIAIGPDGMLYMGLGDGGGAGDPHGNAQKRSTLLGKILRLDPEASGPDDLAASGNPAFGPNGSESEIWLTGVRNPWRFSFDRLTGDLWIGDVGQNKWEEVDLLTKASGLGKGANLGWDLFEGTEKFEDDDPSPGAASDGPFVEPVYTYSHGPGCSITGGVVYRGERIAALEGTYLFSDYCDGTIRGLRTNGPAQEDSKFSAVDLGVELSQVVSFATDARGETYVLSLDQGMFRIVGADTVG